MDRGKYSILTFITILGLLYAWPERICVLRGNHERDNIDKRSPQRFEAEIRHRYYKRPDFIHITRFFRFIFILLPLSALTPQKSLCLHGGIPEDMDRIEDLEIIPKPHSDWITLSESNNRKKASNYLDQIRWNDPDEHLSDEEFEISDRGFEFRKFSCMTTLKFLEKSGANRLIRSHESTRGGFQLLFNKKLIHIFSTEPYDYQIRKAAVVH